MVSGAPIFPKQPIRCETYVTSGFPRNLHSSQDGFSNLATVGGQSIVIIITGLATSTQYQVRWTKEAMAKRLHQDIKTAGGMFWMRLSPHYIICVFVYIYIVI